MTSHTLLERVGVIHEVHAVQDDPDAESHEHHHAHHDFADGNYWVKVSSPKTQKLSQVLLYQTAWLATFATNPSSFHESADFGPAPPGAPPEFLHCWSFLLRTAGDARAPSLLS